MDIWDFIQQRQLNEQKTALSANAQAVGTVQQQMQRLESRVQTLSLACQAMWELLSETQRLSMTDLAQRMREVDLRDGRRDGKYTPKTIRDCPHCGQKLAGQRKYCYGCGEELPLLTPFAG